ncbi:MAG: lipoprotein [Candidatus Magnetoglobus multicellularis str. Araruama]|uniref:Lipoprotein n=1 Tax=Candidatus Magnetoglobus multicellularis str. Araruama TaxID=890399 RepID=A0A1V1PAQ0_9BACT|nr:MAG: lipoprotein [Candidatus Magnetoglobus multicellularis str. Araruama]
MNLRIRIPVLMVISTIILCLMTNGCLTALSKNDKKNRPKTGLRQPTSLYYDFGDVLIPKELKIVQEPSFIYRTGGYACGLMILKGRVELTSLINFFSNNMVKDNWRLLSTFKSPRTLLLFQKDNRWCIITITEGRFTMSTEVAIWVAPTGAQAGTGTMGQPDGFSEALIN